MDEIMNNEGFKAFFDAIDSLKKMDEKSLTEEVMTSVDETIKRQFDQASINIAVNQIVDNFDEQGLSRQEVHDSLEAVTEVLRDMIYGDQIIVGNKKKIIDTVTNQMFDIFKMAEEKYHSYNIVLPITLDDNAQIPTYAHETDAAADLYAREDQVIPAHSFSNMINTGVHIQLPENWVAFILPRSSIGAKTPLRLSNSMGVIDSGYRGFLGIIYDNTSDADYTIHKGDRIAQLLIMPNYRFKANVVETLEDSDRGEGGYGSTGK